MDFFVDITIIKKYVPLIVVWDDFVVFDDFLAYEFSVHSTYPVLYIVNLRIFPIPILPHYQSSGIAYKIGVLSRYFQLYRFFWFCVFQIFQLVKI